MSDGFFEFGYKCKVCGLDIVYQTTEDDELDACPQCSGELYMEYKSPISLDDVDLPPNPILASIIGAMQCLSHYMGDEELPRNPIYESARNPSMN